ncbi:MAG: hypothetical protein HC881_19880 [Leptolyngbyaceae cyanobacterium SL_7_1]|nr:hypothetical protein [Leptolyngbyaceae cyanobacterium SL_7_1]
MPRATAPVNQALEALHTLLEPFWYPEIQLVVDRYQTLPFPFDEISPPPFTRTEYWTVNDLIGCITTWSSVHQLIRQQGETALNSLLHTLQTEWGNLNTQPICWDIYLRVGYVTDSTALSSS